MEKRLLPIIKYLAVEFLVFFFRAVGGIFQPKRMCIVYRLDFLLFVLALFAFTAVVMLVRLFFMMSVIKVNLFGHESAVFVENFAELVF